MHLNCDRDEKLALVSCSSSRCSFLCCRFFVAPPSLSLSLSSFSFCSLVRTFHLGAAYEIYGFYYVIYAMRAVRDGARNATRRNTTQHNAAQRRKCAHRLRVKSDTHTNIYTYVCVHGKREKGGVLFFYYSVSFYGQHSSYPPLPLPFSVHTRFALYLFNFSAGTGQRCLCN